MKIKWTYRFPPIFILVSLMFCTSIIPATYFENHQNTRIEQIPPLNNPNLIYSMENIKIHYPLPSIPTFVEQNEEFNIIFEAIDFDEVSAFISTAYEPVVDQFWLQILDLTKDGNKWHMNASFSSAPPPELYNLTIIIKKNTLEYLSTAPRSVEVINSFSDTFSFVHVTDLHVGDPRGLRENVTETIGFKSIKRCIEEINLVHPDFVVISGDLVFGQLYPYEYKREYQICYEIIQMFDVPTFLVPGNHDGYFKFREDGLQIWDEYFGALYHSFNYGNYHFIGVNSYDMIPILRRALLFIPLTWGGSISDEQLQWIEDDLSTTHSNLTFMFMHHNPLWHTTKDSLIKKEYTNREEILSLIDNHSIDMVLAGHVHYDSVNIINNTIFITTTTPESDINVPDGYWGYRLVEIKDGVISSYNYKEPKYSIPSYKLSASIWKSHSSALAIIENKLEKEIDAQVKFHMPLGNYTVQNGTITIQRNDTSMTEIYVRTPIPATSQQIITISKRM